MKVEIDFYDGGYCYHPEFVAIKGGSTSSVKFPAICAVIHHTEKLVMTAMFKRTNA